MKILVIDNYDSFTYNLVQLVGTCLSGRQGFNGNELIVKRNDEITCEEINKLKPDKILISPGPGIPEDSKVSVDLVTEFKNSIPILGVCLGHQAIAVSFGSKVIKANVLMHGKTSLIKHDNKTIYKNIPQNFEATRYHSLIIDEKTLPEDFEISAETNDGVIMGIRHKNFPVEGIQFHPESILTSEGKKLIKNWLAQ